MRFEEFSDKMRVFAVFSIGDIEKMFPGFSRMNLINWQKKGYLVNIRQGWYCFKTTTYPLSITWLAANRIYRPSCISLQTALSFYGWIPEAIYDITSITSLKTKRFETPLGNFTYQSVKDELMGFGLTLFDPDKNVQQGPGTHRANLIAITEPEKALLDLLYLFPQYKSEEDMIELRLNEERLSQMNKKNFYSHLHKFNNASLEGRVFKLMKTYQI